VVITVHIQAEEERKTPSDDVLSFLKRQNATGINLYLDEPPEVWQEKLHIDFLPPSYFVFSRQGLWTQFKAGDEPIDYGKMDRLVLDLLKEK